jgi:hypothetical protein
MAQPQQLTYDPTPADQPEFSPEEQESLAIGEQAAADQQELLAGKFKDAEALEQAYIELQKKLGTNDDANEAEPAEEVRDEEDSSEEEVNPTYDLLNKASEEFYANEGQISPEVMEELGKLDSNELISAYIALQGQQGDGEAPDLNEQQVNDVKAFAGGEEAYTGLVDWAAENMPKNFVDAFDNLVSFGDTDMIKLAVAGLKSAYDDQNGYEGEMLTGKGAAPTVDVFRSQAEVVQAMSDPRYDRDPAYRQDVFAKLERSNINY